MTAKLRVGFIGLALFLFPTLAAHSEKKQNDTSPFLQAQDLLLKKKRQLAVKLLLKAQPPMSRPKDREVWLETLTDISTRFLTDQGLKSYELGTSQVPRNLKIAENHFHEAESVEDENLDVQLALARVQLMSEECQKSKLILLNIKALSMIRLQINELLLQVDLCLKDEPSVETFLKRKMMDSKLESITNKVAQGWLKLQAKDFLKAQSHLKEALNSEPSHVGALYWLYVTQRELDNEEFSAAEAFQRNCRNFEEDIRRRNRPMIEYCLHLPEVEAYLKANKKENSSE